MICVHSRWEVRGSNLNSRISRTPAAADGWLVSRADRGPVISACHSPDHSSGRGGIRYSGPMSKRPALDGFAVPPGVHFSSSGLR